MLNFDGNAASSRSSVEGKMVGFMWSGYDLTGRITQKYSTVCLQLYGKFFVSLSNNISWRVNSLFGPKSLGLDII